MDLAIMFETANAAVWHGAMSIVVLFGSILTRFGVLRLLTTLIVILLITSRFFSNTGSDLVVSNRQTGVRR